EFVQMPSAQDLRLHDAPDAGDIQITDQCIIDHAGRMNYPAERPVSSLNTCEYPSELRPIGHVGLNGKNLRPAGPHPLEALGRLRPHRTSSSEQNKGAGAASHQPLRDG